MTKTVLKLKIEKLSEKELAPALQKGQKLEFGKLFTDRMFQMRFAGQKGWTDAVIKKYENFSISPAAVVLHYAQEIFEGLKAYNRVDGKIGLFRPRDNFLRMNNSAERVCLPKLEVDFVLEALRELVSLEKRWIPQEEGSSLYIRPTMISVDPRIGLKPTEEFLFFIICSPVGMYYKNGFAPTGIYVEEEYVRAVRGGLGEAKTGANYAASLMPAKKAQEKGFDQVLWLDGVERKYIEEVGSMNIFFLYENELVTPALNGSILPGVTRDSVIKLAKHWNIKVREDKLSIDEIMNDISTGKIIEVFGTGTAAVISPVGYLHYKGKDLDVNKREVGRFTTRLYDNLTGIQYGKVEDPFNWTEIVA